MLVQRAGGTSTASPVAAECRRQLDGLDRLLDRLPTGDDVAAAIARAKAAVDAARDDVADLEQRHVRSNGDDTDAGQQLQELAAEIDRACSAMHREALKGSRELHEAGMTEERDLFIGISNDAETLSGDVVASLDTGSADARTGRQGARDTAAAAVGAGGAGNDSVGGLGGSAVSISDMVTKGSSASGPVSGTATVFGSVAGAVGVVFGLASMALGAKAAAKGAGAEARLKKLVDDGVITDAQVAKMSAFAQEKKRKKKWGGGITGTVGVAGLGAGAIGIVAVSIATFGAAAVVAGIGAALMGLGVVIGKWIHKRRKRKAFQGKIPDLANDLLAQGSDERGVGPIRRQIAAMGVEVNWDSPAAIAAASDGVATALRDRVKSRREFIALELVAYLTGPASVAMFDAEKVIEALHLDAGEIRDLVAAGKAPTAQERVAAKMASW
jgi:hypothetical protein